ncbi:MAG: leucyl aminopeptidase [Cyanobacteria bacterium SIG28]|nr:leucyl aminopeptidase [Cyanobacteria bacterium SIG28]
MEIRIIDNTSSVECDLLVVNKFEGEKTTSNIANTYAIDQDNFEGKFGETYLLPTYGQEPHRKVLVVGFGKKEDFNQDKAREIAAKAIKKAMSIEAKSVGFAFNGVEFDYSRQVAIGIMIADYNFDKYKSEKKDKNVNIVYLEANEEEVRKAEKIVTAMNFTRNLANEPAQYATPSELASIACDLGLETKIYDKEECEKMGMGAFLAVGRGSSEAPKFIHMKYSCENPKKKIALIGKGITFDSGGLDIKPASSMLTMKDDMSGAACVLGIMSILREFNPQVEVHGIIAACENMPGCSAYKPGDILTAKNGKTIEVDNTDAEGRLTLADALCYASELGVDEVIDIATLTGACMVALGSLAAGIVGNDDTLVKNLIRTAEQNGERFWELPLWDEYADSLKSDIADMKNTGSRWGGASTAGCFLKKFVKDVKWAHIDIAGVAFLEKPQKELGKGASGAGVRTLLNYILEQ